MKIALIAALSGALLAVGAQALPSAIGSSEDSTDGLVRPAAGRTTEDHSARREDRREDRRADRREDRREDRRADRREDRREDRRADRREDRREDRRADHLEDRRNGVPEAGEDISGPCDEAEHANDPRCTGAAPRTETGDRHVDDDDRGGDRIEDHRDGDRGGDNSGPGSSSSGPGSGGDDDGDHSGPGPGGGDDD
jgi:hypothetical protein